MSVRHFIKHLCHIHSRHLFLQPPSPSPSPSSSSLLCCLSFSASALSGARIHRSPNTIIARFTSASSPYTPLTSSEETPTPTEHSSSPLPSSSSPYLAVRIHCPKDVSDELSEALLWFGASSTCIDEEDDESIGEIEIESIFPTSEDVGVCISNAANSIGLKKLLNYEVELHKQEDWIRKTQESFYPVEVTEGLWIVPEWRTPPKNEDAVSIILNPGLAFGTGEHPTTKLCLRLLHGLIKGGECFLDYGTGSGVLAIAALKLGAGLAVGVDVDPVAISSARQNADLNNIEPKKMQLHLVPGSPDTIIEKLGGEEEDNGGQISQGHGFVTETDKYDIVVANILLNPLLDLADCIVSYAKPGAIVGVSGILSEQLPQIEGRYSCFLEDISVSELDGWSCLSGKKKHVTDT